MSKKWIVVTSINPPTRAIEKINDLVNQGDWEAVVVGDNKTPASWNCGDIKFLSIEEQHSCYGELSKLIPENHYCRKNLGYLHAIENGAEIILETDDDNIPNDNEFGFACSPNVNVRFAEGEGWVNVYKYYTDENIWPRGLSLKHILDQNLPNLGEVTNQRLSIQQFLANGDPDVDAIYRLTCNKLLDFSNKDFFIGLPRGSWCPFNSQNTLFMKEAFAALYLPGFVSFRMTDIWRSFVAQAALYAKGLNWGFGNATVKQIRNEHDFLIDFKDEVPGYLKNDEIIAILSRALDDIDTALSFSEVCLSLWRSLSDHKIVQKKEVDIYEKWLQQID